MTKENAVLAFEDSLRSRLDEYYVALRLIDRETSLLPHSDEDQFQTQVRARDLRHRQDIWNVKVNLIHGILQREIYLIRENLHIDLPKEEQR